MGYHSGENPYEQNKRIYCLSVSDINDPAPVLSPLFPVHFIWS